MESLSRRNQEKLTHENEIITAAEKVFRLKGFDDSSMNEIAKEARFTKRTVYQYFENKEDLFFAVVLKEFKDMWTKIMEDGKGKLSGFEKIEQVCANYLKFFTKNPETSRLIYYWGYLKAKSSAIKREKELVEFNNGLLSYLAAKIEEGKSDGSVHKEVDSKNTALSLIFLMTGFLNQLSIMGDSFTEPFSLKHEELSKFTIELITKSLKNSKAIAIGRKGTA